MNGDITKRWLGNAVDSLKLPLCLVEPKIPVPLTLGCGRLWRNLTLLFVTTFWIILRENSPIYAGLASFADRIFLMVV